jgi:hypothetical protein
MSIARTFKATEKLAVDFSANFTNFLNHAQFGIYGGYNTSLGGINLTPNGPTNTQLGQPTGSSSYGTHGLSTYDPRQIEFQLKIRF